MDNSEIIKLHGKLAKRIKQFETNLDEYLPTEVANELRYALRATIEILDLNCKEDVEVQLEEAKQKTYHALICAYHDLVDGLALHISVTLDELRKQYLEESIFILGDKRLEIISLLNEVNEKIAISRERTTDRKVIYDEDLYDNYFEKLIDYRKYLMGQVLDDIVLLHDRKKKKKKFTTSLTVLGLFLAFIGIVIGLP